MTNKFPTMDLRVKVAILLCLFLQQTSSSFINVYPKLKSYPHALGEDVGEPLIVTPYLKNGTAAKARELAAVTFDGANFVHSYSGFFTVNKTADSNMFFWYFEAAQNASTAPVVLWLQGGPGASSLFGLFTENGPFYVDKDMKLAAREFSWHKDHHLIYLDNPVGTGFSFSEESGYARNEVDVGVNLHEALQQFFTMFPDLRSHPLFLTGESYAGKYVPAAGHRIHKMNAHLPKEQQINLQGLAIGNGLSDPQHQLKYGDYLYQLGLIDRMGRDLFHKYEKMGADAIHRRDFNKAFEIFDELINMDELPSGSLFHNMTGLPQYFNYIKASDDGLEDRMAKFLQLASTRKAIHVGNSTFHGLDGDNRVEELLKQDVMDSVAIWVTELVNNYRVCIYNGQLDIIVAYPLTVNYLNKLPFNDKELYLKAPRYIWRVDGEVAGYAKEAGNLVEVLVRKAGHMAPGDQPKFVMDMLMRLTHGDGFKPAED